MMIAARKIGSSPSPTADLQPLVAACKQAREVLTRADAEREQLPQRLAEARYRVADCEKELAAAEIENEAHRLAGNVRDKAEIAAAMEALSAAQSELATIERAMRGVFGATEKLRADLDAKHDALSTALNIATDPVRSAAIVKYRAGLQLVKDALSIVDALDSSHSAFEPGPSDIVSQEGAWSRTEPSAEVRDLIQPFEAALYEQRRSIARLCR